MGERAAPGLLPHPRPYLTTSEDPLRPRTRLPLLAFALLLPVLPACTLEGVATEGAPAEEVVVTAPAVQAGTLPPAPKEEAPPLPHLQGGEDRVAAVVTCGTRYDFDRYHTAVQQLGRALTFEESARLGGDCTDGVFHEGAKYVVLDSTALPYTVHLRVHSPVTGATIERWAPGEILRW